MTYSPGHKSPSVCTRAFASSRACIASTKCRPLSLRNLKMQKGRRNWDPGWTGVGTQITPPIAPGALFVARMAPPRAGTFIYHTHWHDSLHLTNGIYGPLIVLPPGAQFDPESDLAFVFSIGDFGALRELALINGTPQSKT